MFRPNSAIFRLEYSIWGKLFPSHLHLDQTDNFPQMLYSNLKMAELGRNM